MKAQSIISRLDFQMAVAIGICIVLSQFVWDKIQIMTSCIAVLLCTQESSKFSLKAGGIRLVITVIGAFFAVVLHKACSYIGNDWLPVIIIMAGVLLTLWGCKLAKVPAFNARIGAVSFILVYFTPGAGPLQYGIFRVVSTFVGALVVLIVALIVGLFIKNDTAAQQVSAQKKGAAK